jgi:SAM-dependent methyltransferase
MKQTSEFYQTTGNIPFASRISVRARMKMFKFFMSVMVPSETATILDVGVSCDESHPASNMLEYCYPYKNRITCAGVEDARHLERVYPGVHFLRIQPHQRLPFANKQFDIAYSNAVLEHVGTRVDQKAFIHELCRVGKRVFITVPNRLFPVEHHTAIPLIHYLPNTGFRVVAKALGLDFWSKEKNLNLFYPWEIKGFFPEEMLPRLVFTGIGLSVFRPNICAYSTGFKEKSI